MQMKRIMTFAATLGVLSSGSAFAEDNYRAPWRGDFWGYIGASGGESKFRTDCQQGVTRFFDCGKRDTGFKIYSGGKLSELLGLEIGYANFGKISASGGETKAWAVPIVFTVGTPLGARFGILGKIGGVYGRTDVNADPGELFNRGRKNGWGGTYGVGGTFAMTPNVQLRADWDRYKLDFVGGRRDVDMLTAGLQVRF